MANTRITLYEQAKNAKSPEEIMELAKKYNMALTLEEATRYFKKADELTDEELGNIAGGCPDSQSFNPEGLKVGDHVYNEMNLRFCDCLVNEYIVEEVVTDCPIPVLRLRCVKCGASNYCPINGHHVIK